MIIIQRAVNATGNRVGPCCLVIRLLSPALFWVRAILEWGLSIHECLPWYSPHRPEPAHPHHGPRTPWRPPPRPGVGGCDDCPWSQRSGWTCLTGSHAPARASVSTWHQTLPGWSAIRGEEETTTCHTKHQQFTQPGQLGWKSKCWLLGWSWQCLLTICLYHFVNVRSITISLNLIGQ